MVLSKKAFYFCSHSNYVFSISGPPAKKKMLIWPINSENEEDTKGAGENNRKGLFNLKPIRQFQDI